ncbi:MAG: PfkB family carbohydrate kinase [Terriglobia bacterium]
MRIVSIGEVLWDVIGDKEYLGGAALNFAAHAARLGHTVFFVSAVGKDERGRRVLERMSEIGLSSRFVRQIDAYPTGVVTVELDRAGVPQFTIHHPAAYDAPELGEDEVAELLSPKPDWIYFGTLFQMSPQAKQLTYRLTDSHSGTQLLYDVNLRKESYTAPLVRELMARAQVAKLNEDEAAGLNRMLGRTSQSLEDFCRSYARDFGWESVCITRGEKGCAMLVKEEYVEASGYKLQIQDTVGAGDAFAAAFIHGLSLQWPPTEIADFANRVAALVASRAGGTPAWTLEEVRALQ